MATECRSEITDFEVGRAADGVNMMLKLGLKFYETRCANQLMDSLMRLDGVKSARWEMD